jgi:hypothetical protein
MVDPIVLSVSTDECKNFENSLKKFGWKYKILGRGHEWGGWVWRMKIYLESLKKLHPDTKVILSDASDVIALRGPPMDIDENINIMVGAESLCSLGICKPILRFTKLRNIKGKKKFINAGLIYGKAGKIMDMYSWIIEKGFKDDNLGICIYFEKNYTDLSLSIDSESKYFFNNERNMHSNNTSAFFIHFPGMYTKDRYALNFVYALVGKTPKNYYNSTASQILEEFEKAEYKDITPIAIVFWIMIVIITLSLIFFKFF